MEGTTYQIPNSDLPYVFIYRVLFSATKLVIVAVCPLTSQMKWEVLQATHQTWSFVEDYFLRFYHGMKITIESPFREYLLPFPTIKQANPSYRCSEAINL